MGIIFISMRR